MTNRPEPYRERLPATRDSLTHKFNVGEYEGYIHVGMYEDGRPGEVFLSGMGKDGSFVQGVMGSFAVTLSVALQHGVTMDTLARKYVGVRFEAGPTPNTDLALPEVNGRPEAASVMDYIGRWLALRFGSDELRAELNMSPSGRHERGSADKPSARDRRNDVDEKSDQRAEDEAAQEQRENADGKTGGEQVENAEGGQSGDVKEGDKSEGGE